MIKAVIFDMDGTLIDTETYYRICWPRALAEYGYVMTDEQALSMRSLGRPFAQARLKALFGEDVDYEGVRSLRQKLMEEALKREGIRLKPGARELLSYLRERGFLTAVATASGLERTQDYLGRLGLLPFFDRIISAVMVEEGKPSPDIYLYACNMLGLPPAACLAVEDSPNGVLSAYRAGCKVLMVPDQTQPDAELEKLLFAKADTLLDVRDILAFFTAK